MLDVLGKRLGRYGLRLHETKTRYGDFRSKRPRAHDPDTTFDFRLTHHCEIIETGNESWRFKNRS